MAPRTGRPITTGRAKHQPMSIRPTPDERDKLRQAAALTGRSVAAYVLWTAVRAAERDIAATRKR